MEIHQKEAKRDLLMESAYKKFQELFDMGRTDEEAILDYANRGVQVPEQMVKRFREQYNKMKEMKLEYMKNEQEFKNQAKEIVRCKRKNQKIFVWGYDPKQGHEAWCCNINDVIKLGKFIDCE